MQYDMAYKRALRLQNRSWAEIQVEAHKLAALGLEVTVGTNAVNLQNKGMSLVRIRPNGEVLLHKPNRWGWYQGDVSNLAQVLRDLLAQRQAQAATLAGVAAAMKRAIEAQS